MNPILKSCFYLAFVVSFVSVPMSLEPALAQRATQRNQTQRSPARRPQAKQKQRSPSRKKSDSNNMAVIRGKAAHVEDRHKKQIKFEEIVTSLHQRVLPPPVPVPRNWDRMKPADQEQWLDAFKNSDKGKKYIEEGNKLLDNAPVFEVKYDDDGSFAIYDVPPGTYGLQGRFDKEINGIVHAFEVFAQIVVERDVQILDLKPIPIVVTPLFKSGQPSPKISVETYDGKDTLTLDTPSYQDKYLFVNFWFTGDQGQKYQNQVQKMYGELKGKYPIKLISICVDENRKAAIKSIVKAKYKLGSHGFTDGWEHPTIEAFGVRSTPSGWLIGPDRKIAMTQHEFYQAVKIKDSITSVIRDRIEGKDKPTPAERPTEDVSVQDKTAKNAGRSNKK